MKLFKRGTRLERQLAASDLEIAMGRAEQAAAARESFTARCTRVRTPQGRIAHLKHPDLGVLCGWRGAETEADPSLPVCRLCTDALAGIGELAS